jgi:hypothetical protein
MSINRRKQTNPTVGDINAGVAFQHSTSGHAVYGTWVFRSRAPLEVILRLNVGRRAFVEWVLSRNMLNDAMAFPGDVRGVGDVRIVAANRGEDDFLYIELRAPSGMCVLFGSASDACDFLDATCGMIPICDNIE